MLQQPKKKNLSSINRSTQSLRTKIKSYHFNEPIRERERILVAIKKQRGYRGVLFVFFYWPRVEFGARGETRLQWRKQSSSPSFLLIKFSSESFESADNDPRDGYVTAFSVAEMCDFDDQARWSETAVVRLSSGKHVSWFTMSLLFPVLYLEFSIRLFI